MTWRFINYQRYDAFENMAIDEAIFKETVKWKKTPTIRFYGWNPAAVSVGYFQDTKSEINITECRNMGVDVVRRLTGGKAVFHHDEITYSVAAATAESLFPIDILGTYKVISDCLIQGLSYLGIKADLASTGRTMSPADLKSCCFSVPSRNELLVAGRKICGSAQMRTKGGFLQHGSLLLTFDAKKALSVILPASTPEHLTKINNSVAAINEVIAHPVKAEDICNLLKQGFIDMLGVEIVEETLTTEENMLKDKLLGKYKDLSWNQEQRR